MLWVIVLLYLINTAVALAIALRDVQRPLRAFTWVLVHLVLPGVGLLIYWIFSHPISLRPEQQDNLKKTSSPLKHDASHLSASGFKGSLRHSPIPRNDLLPREFGAAAQDVSHWVARVTNTPPILAQVKILGNGITTFKHLLEAIHQAEEQIDIEYYIYRDDDVGRAVTAALLKKAAEGVRIRFLRDGLGSRKLPKSLLREMQKVGIEIRTMHPFRFPWITQVLNHRDHCKIVVIDSQRAFTGGINVGDEYTGRSRKTGPWRDTDIEVRGPAAHQLEEVFQNNWSIGSPFRTRNDQHPVAHGNDPVHATQRVPTAATIHTAGVNITNEDAKHTRAANYAMAELAHELVPFPTSPSLSHKGFVQTVSSGPDSITQEVRDLFFLCATEAETTLDITTPYFVPDTDIVTALKTAAARGVAVRLLVPEKPDHTIIGWASKTFYRDLIEAGINIFLYQEGVLHAKVVVVDGQLAIVGAANYDLRSFRENYEVCEVVYDEGVSNCLTEQFERDLDVSRLLTTQELDEQGTAEKIRNSGARLLAPLL